MKVGGFDPALRNWGIAEGDLDLKTGVLSDLTLTLVSPEKLAGKQVRNNSSDLHRAEMLAQAAMRCSKSAGVLFVEVPVGSQSA